MRPSRSPDPAEPPAAPTAGAASPAARWLRAPAVAACAACAALLILTGCDTPAASGAPGANPLPPNPGGVASANGAAAARALELAARRVDPHDAARVDRVTGGADARTLAAVADQGWPAWLSRQLHPPADAAPLPAAVRDRIATMRITRVPLAQRVREDEAQRLAAEALPDEDARAAARKAYQRALADEGTEATQRWLLQAVLSPWQVQERMTWFWLNHFSVAQAKGNLRAFVGDYEAQLRPLALGKFRDLLRAAALHPAMLRYLDNERNAAGRLNENFARELLELHTLGVDGGYSQQDVQQLARVLTGLGLRVDASDATLPPALADRAPQYVHRGLMEFNPARHATGAKMLLGERVAPGGLDEIEAVLDRLARHPATARHVCGRLARYWLGGDPPPALVARMAQRFTDSDGDIAAVLQLLFTAPEFEASLGTRFKDPWRWMVSATRLAYDGADVIDATPLVNGLARLGESPFGHATPEGYSLDAAAWSGPGQLTQRFDVARAIVGNDGRGNINFFRTEGRLSLATVPQARRQSAAWSRTQAPRLSDGTRGVLDELARVHPGDWAWAALSSPEFMVD